ncbi:MAG TPA: nucleoside triphosphate pyrophosphohydrolase [Candidatus Dormibacteraeota bacterium]|nr:nucleoside triphosphate pyrophosphohydrolase [Candidatus Dormibacteraeota bacterium]
MLDALLAEARLRWGLDPSLGLQVVPAERLAAFPLEPSRPALVVPLALLRVAPADPAPVEPVPGRHGHGGDAIALLRRLYPAEHPVGRLGAAEGSGVSTVGALTDADLGGALYLSPLPATEAYASPWAMPAISDRLRRPDGCPWDREQTHRSLRRHLLEEAYEVYDALDAGSTPELAEELGDLWLQIVLHAQLAAEDGVFDLADVHAAIASKIVRRHPHVFGDAEARTAGDVNRQWERIKAAERAAIADEAGAERPKSALEGISPAMPALAASREMQERAAHLGYDWPSIDGVLEKAVEELGELRAAGDEVEREEELGDLLMVVVNVGRKLGIDAEAALRGANAKFRRRFAVVERLAAERGVALRDLSFEALDELWDAAKAELAAGGEPVAMGGATTREGEEAGA